MVLVPLQLVTIIAERLLEDRLLREIRALGVHGFTVTDVRGEGTRGVRASEWEGANVKIETLVAPDVAEQLVAHVAARYFQHHAVIVYRHEAHVVRGDKYV